MLRSSQRDNQFINFGSRFRGPFFFLNTSENVKKPLFTGVFTVFAVGRFPGTVNAPENTRFNGKTPSYDPNFSYFHPSFFLYSFFLCSFFLYSFYLGHGKSTRKSPPDNTFNQEGIRLFKLVELFQERLKKRFCINIYADFSCRMTLYFITVNRV